LSEDSVRLVVYWVLGGVPLVFGVWIAFFNVFRHWEMRRIRKSGRTQNISGTPLMAPLFFLVGWWITPLGFTPWIFLIFLAEGPAWITISPPDDPSE
jgi:hypothetical protein